jgi:hypothetical protein
MCEFVVDQVLGINGLINLSNIVFSWRSRYETF